MDPAFPFFCGLCRSPLGNGPYGCVQCIPVFIILYFTRESVETLFNKNLSENSIAWLSANSLLLFLGTLLFVAIYNFLPKIANAIAKKSGILKLEDALILKETFEDIVGIKSDRIGGEC